MIKWIPSTEPRLNESAPHGNYYSPFVLHLARPLVESGQERACIDNEQRTMRLLRQGSTQKPKQTAELQPFFPSFGLAFELCNHTRKIFLILQPLRITQRQLDIIGGLGGLALFFLSLFKGMGALE